MKAIMLTAPQRWSLTEVHDPVPAERQVVVAVRACGICGTDLHTFDGDNALVRLPITPGHEFVGEVVDTGPSVGHLAVGDHVAVDPSGSCGCCWNCRSGWPNLCPEKGGHGSRHPGGFAEYVAVREESCVRLDPSLSWATAALAEPLACVLHGMDRLGSVLGKEVLVYGAGAIGVLAANLLAKAGASVRVVETSPERRQAAVDVGAGEIMASPDDAPSAQSWDVVLDATGSIEAMEDAFTRLGRAGTLLFLGVAPREASMRINPWAVNWHELTIIGSMAVRHTFQRAVELLPRCEAPLTRLVTHALPLERFDSALELVRQQQALKVQICPDAGHPPEGENPPSQVGQSRSLYS